MSTESQVILWIDKAAKIRDLASAAQTPLDCTVTEAGGNRIILRCQAPLAPSSAVRVDIQGALVLGEVLGFIPEGTECQIVVGIEQVIPSLTDVENLMQRVFGEHQRDEPQQAGRSRAGLASSETV